MPQYAVIGHHPPDNCPTTNRAVRELAVKSFEQLPQLAQKLGVKVLLAIHLDPNHKALILFEAANAEAVRDLLMQGGFFHFVELEFHLVTPLDKFMTKEALDQIPTIY